MNFQWKIHFTLSAVGYSALAAATASGNNIAVGSNASFNMTGSTNVAIGINTLYSTSGNSNIAIGYYAGNTITSGSGNIHIGDGSSGLITTGNNNIIIGNEGTAGDTTTIRIGTLGTQTKNFQAGIFGTTVGGSGVPVEVDNTGQLGTVVSSKKYKHDIQPLNDLSSRIFELQPVSFKYNPDRDASQTTQYGLIAEEVEQVYPELVVYKDGIPETVSYKFIPIFILSEMIKMKSDNAKLLDEMNKMKSKIAELEQNL